MAKGGVTNSRDADFPGEFEKHCLEPRQLAATLDLNSFDAAIVMSHHLESDREYLRQIAASEIAYLGCSDRPREKNDCYQNWRTTFAIWILVCRVRPEWTSVGEGRRPSLCR